MILTEEEAMKILDYTTVEDMPGKITEILLPAIDDYLKNATGKDWGKDETIDPLAKSTAGVLLIRWFEDPGQIENVNDIGLVTLINQLEAKYLHEKQAIEDG